MAVTSGFFTSLNGDRKYSAEQLTALFDGFVTDGVMQTVGNVFEVKSLQAGSRVVTVDTGRAWFDNIWIRNDAIITIDVPLADVLLNRWDAVVIEVNKNIDTRAAILKVVSGTPANDPVKPTMTHTEFVTQYPIAYIYCAAGTEFVTDADITQNVGTESCPYAGLIDQSKWIADEEAIFNAFMADLHERISEDAIAQYVQDVEDLKEEVETYDQRIEALEEELSGGIVLSVAGRSGDITLTAADIGAGTFPNDVAAPASANYTIAHMCNMVALTTAPTAGSQSPYPNGTLGVVYK